MSNYVKYAQLANVATNYGKRMKYLSNRIFGEVVRPTNPKSMKVVRMFQAKPMHLNPDLLYYYPRHVETHKLMLHLRDYGLFRDEHQDFIEEMVRLRALRGKVKTWKGEGKRTLLKAGAAK